MLHVVIMAGGSGTRFWPLSRLRRGKQFLALSGDQPLLRSTFERVGALAPPERTWVVTTAAGAGLARAMLPELPAGNVLVEPCGRDTAACVGLAAHVLQAADPEATCVVLPADHVVRDGDAFVRAMTAGAAHVEAAGGLLTFGIRPLRPETGYGYLRVGERHAEVDGLAVHRLETFVEKPELAAAESYLRQGSFLWNSGMFAWRADSLLTEIERQLPRLAQGLARIRQGLGTPQAAQVLTEVYPTLQRISIDYGVMEGAEERWTIPVEFPWSDVGAWPAVAELLPRDEHGNAASGRVLALDGRDNVLVSDGPLIAVIGCEKLAVVATADAVLVAPLSEAQRVKQVVEALKARGWDDVL